MKQLLSPSNAAFSASAGTITFSTTIPTTISHILHVTNITRGALYYQPQAGIGYSGTYVSPVLTLNYPTSTHADTDKLEIFYDDNINYGTTTVVLTGVSLGKVSIDQTIPGTTNNVIAGGATVNPIATPVITAGLYATGTVIGGLMTFANAARVSSGRLDLVTINCKSSQTLAMDFVLFEANPTGSTITDKSAISIAVSDIGKVIGVVHITDWVNLGTPSIATAVGVNLPFVITSGTSLYGVLVARSAPTFSSTSDIIVELTILQD